MHSIIISGILSLEKPTKPQANNKKGKKFLHWLKGKFYYSKKNTKKMTDLSLSCGFKRKFWLKMSISYCSPQFHTSLEKKYLTYLHRHFPCLLTVYIFRVSRLLTGTTKEPESLSRQLTRNLYILLKFF